MNKKVSKLEREALRKSIYEHVIELTKHRFPKFSEYGIEGMVALTLDDTVLVINLTEHNCCSDSIPDDTHVPFNNTSDQGIEIKEENVFKIKDEPFSDYEDAILKIPEKSPPASDKEDDDFSKPNSSKRKRPERRSTRSSSGNSRSRRRDTGSIDYSELDTEDNDFKEPDWTEVEDSPKSKRKRTIKRAPAKSFKKKVSTREAEIRQYTHDQEVIDVSPDNTPLDASIVDQFEDLPLLPEPEKKFGLSRRPKPSNLPRKYPCDICDKSFKNKTHMEEHRRLHTGEKPFKCLKCDFEASHGSNFRIHLKNCHPEVDPYPCPYCDRAFKIHREQRAHIREDHSRKSRKE